MKFIRKLFGASTKKVWDRFVIFKTEHFRKLSDGEWQYNYRGAE